MHWLQQSLNQKQYRNYRQLKYLFYALWLLGFNAAAETVRFFYSELPPYEYTTADGGADGIGIREISAVLIAAGFIPTYELYSIQRGLAALQTDIEFTAVVAPSLALRAEFELSTKPVYQIKLGVVRHKNTAKLTQLSSLQQHNYVSLAATSFGYLSDSEQLPAPFFTNQYKVDSLDDALRLIYHQRYPYFLSYFLSEQELKSPFLLFDELKTLPVYLAMAKRHPNAGVLMQRVNQTMLQNSN